MHEFMVGNVPVSFPYEPYDIQKKYMEKVIECLQNECNGVLESPTGTGKTLSLLCASLAWLQMKKAQVQAQRQRMNFEDDEFFKSLKSKLQGGAAVPAGRAFIGLPSIIYASRTHSQLSQAMQELKKTAYNHMKATVLGSREQMCIHPELATETNAMKVLMCGLKVKSRGCHFHNRNDRFKDDPIIKDLNIIDIEDIVKLGQIHKFCPYYMSRELKQQADIIFMPYQYLIDPQARKIIGVELTNNIIIFDEAHNVEKTCEESASLQIKSTDITLCIDEVTTVMKRLSEDALDFNDDADVLKSLSSEELIVFKEMLLKFEKELDEIEIKKQPDMTVLNGSYVLDMFANCNINTSNCTAVMVLIEKLVQFLSISSSDGPYQRKGAGLMLFGELLRIAFTKLSPDFKNKLQECYKVHISVEEPQKKAANGWFTKAAASSGCRVLSYWCFSPSFGMNLLMEQGVRCVILTSGTLAPLKPLIAELDIPAPVQLENPHIVKGDQVCVKIIQKGPDGELLNCSFQNRDNFKYINSLGRTIVNLSRLIPHGLLIFFPSYPIMLKFKQFWEENGIWDNLCQQKAVYVEPRQKDAFNAVMTEYYAKVKDPTLKGAIFMGVCRGKVSEGLDFADANGRAVIVIGLPFPPLKDPRVILKRQYMDIQHSRNNDSPRGNEWYTLEATKAVNQAIGRVIRHQHDYGAILLLDSRFNSQNIQSQLSRWLRNHIQVVDSFGQIIRDLRGFYKNAEIKCLSANKNQSKTDCDNASSSGTKRGSFDYRGTSLDGQSPSTSTGLVTIHKRPNSSAANVPKKRKIVLVPNKTTIDEDKALEVSSKEYVIMVQNSLGEAGFKEFLAGLTSYKESHDIDKLISNLDNIFGKRQHLRYLIQGLETYIRPHHKTVFAAFWERMSLT